MAITSFDTLKTAIKSELARTNLDNTRLEEAIRSVEHDLEQEDDFVAAFLETRATNTFTTGDQYLGLQADVIEGRPIKSLKITNPVSPALEFKPPYFLDAIEANDTQGQPLFYTLVGQQIRVVPTPDSAYPVEMIYFAQIPQLGDGTGGTVTTNKILTNNPDLYKWGAISDLLPFVGGQQAQRLANAPARYLGILDKAIKTARQRRIPRGPQRMRRFGTTV